MSWTTAWFVVGSRASRWGDYPLVSEYLLNGQRLFQILQIGQPEDVVADVEHTEDGRYIVVGGRRWRATDPNIPERLRKELVQELMAARRGLGAAKLEPSKEDSLRRRVQNAKVALGERGEPWWESPTPDGRAERFAATTLALLSKRGEAKSICPSEVARIAASPDWRNAMVEVRAVAKDLSDAGMIRITQGTETVVDPMSASGPIRLRLPIAGLAANNCAAE